MSTKSSNIIATDLDFEAISENIKKYLKGQDKFKDYDFDGSAIQVLLDILSSNTYYNSMYQNMVSNESFLDSSILRESVVSNSKVLGYTPRSQKSAQARITLFLKENVQNNGTAVQALEPNATYQWLDCDLNRPVGGAQSRIYEPYYDGNFALIVNNGFCADTSECFSLATTGIRELSKEGIKVYPIPSQERLFLEISPEWSQSSYQIRDLQGRVLRAAELDQSSQQELALNVPEGLYILHIQKGARQLSFRILVKP